jgi:hypothetical protein
MCDRCTYAHSQNEQREWNSQRVVDSARPKFSRVKSEPIVRSYEAAPIRKKRVYSVASDEGENKLSMKSNPAAVGAEARKLTRQNYKSQFCSMIELEKEFHSAILRKRCDGLFKFVIGSGHPPRKMYFSGISGDNISYVAQASDSFSITTRDGSEIPGEISYKNFSHTEEILYVEVKERDLSEAGFQRKHEWQVNVQFHLKGHYFDSLKRFVTVLPDVIISRLNPMEFTPLKQESLDGSYENLSLHKCSDDQCNALAKIASCPDACPPLLVTGPFGTGKTRILALAAHYFLQNVSTSTSILVCTQQHTSADAFLECVLGLCICMPPDIYIARVKKESRDRGKYLRSFYEFSEDFRRNPPTEVRPYLIITTCQGSHQLKKMVPKNFSFTHIFIDEVGHMREAEAVAPLCHASSSTRIVLAGDKRQVRYSILHVAEMECGSM